MNPESFNAHPVFEKLTQFNQAISNESAKEKIPLNEATFFLTAYEFLVNNLQLTIPILIQETELNALSNEIDQAASQINSFIGNNNTGHLTNATNNINSSFSRIRNFPLVLSKGNFDFSRAVSIFQQTATTSYTNLQNLNSKLSSTLVELQNNLEAKKTELKALEQKISAKETEIQNALTKYNSEFETIKTSANADFETEKKKFNLSIEDDRKAFKEQFEASQVLNKSEFEKQSEKFKEESDQTIQHLNSKLEEAKKIVNIVGNVGVTGNYQIIANSNGKAADQYRNIALGFMVVMSGLLIWSIIEISRNGEFNFYKSLVRIVAAAVLTYPAVYAAQESSKHRKLETLNRNLELELASIGPFIELLPEDKKHKLKEDLTNKYFGNRSTTSMRQEGETDVSVTALERIFKAVLPLTKRP